MKLKIFSDRQELLPGMMPSAILFPFWQDLYSDQLYAWKSPYDRYVEIGRSLFEMTSFEDADFSILPFDWHEVRGDSWRTPINRVAQKMADRFAERFRGKPLVVFFGSDCSDEKISIDNAIVFRQSTYRSRSQHDPNSFVFPFFCEDYVEQYFHHELPIRQKREKPTVGFCGFARSLSLRRRLQTPLYHAYQLATQGKIGASLYKGQSLRIKALNLLSAHSGIETNFIIRDQAVFFHAPDPTRKKLARMEFVQNLIQSDYVFCCRGAGNYSNRLYEVLSCGRIPVLLNTDCEMPLEPWIDWKKYCVWVDEKDLPNLGDKILEFHHQLSDQDFMELQQACRSLWQQWLSPEGFFANFDRCFLPQPLVHSQGH